VGGDFIRYVLAWSLALVLLYCGGNAINPFAAALAHALPVGTVVPVHYDPRDPTRSVLEPRARASAWIALLAGIGWAMVGRRYWRRALAESRASASVEAVVSERST
jgi:hypothetical protein